MAPTGNVVARIETLARFGAGEAGITRPLFSEAEHRARVQFATWARASNFSVSQDGAGNVFARRAARRGEKRRPILIGSHLDTVRGGGAYDGAYGVVAALGVLEALDAAEHDTAHPIEAVAWAGEEGSRFPLGCLGSGAYSGANPLEDIERLVDADGESFSTARGGPFGVLTDVDDRIVFPMPAAYLEVHVEQGPMLENAGERLGVVTAIAGARRFDVEIAGRRDHAGTVPMGERRDALCAGAEIVLAVEIAARDLGDCVATVGRLAVTPNETNVVPGYASLRVDLRSVDDARVERLEAILRAVCADVGRRRGVDATVRLLERRDAVPMDARVRGIVHAAIAGAGHRAVDVPSGAGHDAMCLATIVPAGLLFVPSAGGRSHTGDEYTAPDDLEHGVAMLTRAAIDVDRALAAQS